MALVDPVTGQITDLGARSAAYQAPAWANGGIVAVDSGLERNDLVLVDPDTAELTRLATFEGSISFVVAPDRTRLAVLVLPPAPAGGSAEIPIRSVQPELTPLVPGELVVLDLTTGALTPVTADPVVAFSWGPTGERLAYLRLTAGGPQWVYWNETQVLQSVPYVPSARTTEAYLPFFAQYAQSLSWWSPDGRAYAFAGQVGEEAGVWVDRLDDTGGPFLVAPGTHVAWSR